MIATKCHAIAGSPRGFSLVELLFVLAIIALVTVIATLRGQAVLGRVSVQADAARMADLDAHARRRAIDDEYGVWLVFELNSSSVQMLSARPGGQLLSPPAAFNSRISAVSTVDQTATSGQHALLFTCQGSSPTYAVRLAQGQRYEWVVVIGGSGQNSRIESDDELAELLEDFANAGIDAG